MSHLPTHKLKPHSDQATGGFRGWGCAIGKFPRPGGSGVGGALGAFRGSFVLHKIRNFMKPGSFAWGEIPWPPPPWSIRSLSSKFSSPKAAMLVTTLVKVGPF